MRHVIDTTSDIVAQTIEEMVEFPSPVSPRLVILAKDSVGGDRVGALLLDFPNSSGQEDRRQFMSDLGVYAATLDPYFPNLVEVHYLQKRTCDLRALGYGSEETVIIMSILSVVKDKMETKVLLFHGKTQGMAGFRVIAAPLKAVGVEPPLIYELIRAFVQSYVDHAPTVRSN